MNDPCIFKDNVEANESEETGAKIKIPKPPPIFVAGVKVIKPLIDLLRKICSKDFFFKIQSNSEVKVQTNNEEDYRKVVQELTLKNTEFHTYKPKQLRNFRVVLRGIHPATDIDDLKQELETLNFKVASIHNIKNRLNGSPLPLFYVDLYPEIDNKNIYSITHLMHTRISIEAPHHKKEIPQCARCQRYGHTHKFCNRDARCVKCAGEHETKNCTRKTKDSNVKCVLCSGNHPANYKGCQFYKDLQKKQFPTLRKKEISPTEEKEIPEPAHVNLTANLRQPNVSYSAAAKGTGRQQCEESSPLQQQTTTPQSSDIAELKDMVKMLINQISPLINLLTTLVTRMK